MNEIPHPSTSLNLNAVREAIDSLDIRIIELLKERAGYVHQVGAIKKDAGTPIFVPEREVTLMEKIKKHNDGVLPDEALKAIYREIISCSLALEGGVSVAYLGPEGTWSHVAALKQFGSSVELHAQGNFRDIFEQVARGKVSYGILPVENSTEGSVSSAMDMFTEYDVTICAQVLLPIRNGLLSATNRESIKTIYSHSQVLGQCRRWLAQHFPKAELIETVSTTKAAQMAHDQAHEGAASLGNPLAAQLFGLNVLEEDVQDNIHNATRFVVLGKQDTVPTGKDKTSLLFYLRHEPGSLVKALQCFEKHGIDLTRIESRPSHQENWEYVFFVDVNGHQNTEPLCSALKELKTVCSSVKVLGSYTV